MKIADVKIFLNDGLSDNINLKAYAQFCLRGDGLCFRVDNIKIIDTGKKLIVSMPSKKIPKKLVGGYLYKDVIFPTDQRTRIAMERIIIATYRAEVEKVKDKLQK